MKIAQSKIVIATHYWVSCLSDALVDFLNRNHVRRLIYFRHPLFPSENKFISRLDTFESGILKKSLHLWKISLPFTFRMLKEMIINILYILKSRERWNLFIGIDNLNAFSGLILRILGRVDKVIYFTIDFSPNRFDNQILNSIYHFIDKICVRFCDETWNLSPRMAEGREEYFGMDKKIYNRQVWVPHGARVGRMQSLINEDKYNKNTIVFLGHLIQKQGIQEVIKAVPLIIKKIPNFKFIIIGAGNHKKKLEDLTAKLKIQKHILFTGYLDNEKSDKILTSSAIGIAPYTNSDNFSYYADPGKIKDYLAAGLPVILTRVPYNAGEIQEKECGIIVNFHKNDIAEAVIGILKDKDKLEKYRKNVRSYAKSFDWDHIFRKNIERVL